MVGDIKKLRIVIAIAVGLVISIIGWAIVVSRPTPPTTKTTSTVDTVTGETIVTVDGKSPEKGGAAGATGPALIGAESINPLFGDDAVVMSIKDNVFPDVYKAYGIVKIAKDNVKKSVVTQNATTTITVSFRIYLDSNTAKYDGVTVAYKPDTGSYTMTISGDYTNNYSSTFSTLGHD